MNKLFNISTLIAFLALVLTSCSPDNPDLGRVDVKAEDLVEGIAFDIEHDAENPNIVYLTSKMGGRYTPLWNHPQGRSQKEKVTLKMPFAGTYKVEFGVMTRGGAIYGEPVTFEIDDMYAGFIEDDVWTMIAGGAGESKTWYLDLDADAVSRHFEAPLYFFTGTYSWDALHTPTGDNYLDSDAWDWKKAISPLADEDGNAAWYWLADYPGNSWMCEAANYGSMTFDLIDGANVVVDQEEYGLNKSTGTYMLDVDEHTISFTDAKPLHVVERTDEVAAATEFRILYLTEEFMQIMVVPSGTSFNYISKEYRDNWTPGEEEEPEPPYDGNANDDLTTSVTNTKTWNANLDAPYNWASLGGEFKNTWIKNADGIPVYEDWEPPYDADALSLIEMKLTKEGDNTGTYEVVNSLGETFEGDYSVDDKNWIDFGQDFELISGLDWVSFGTSEGKVRMISTEKDALGNIKVLHLGVLNPGNATEYMTIALVQGAGSGSTEDPEVTIKKMLCAKSWKLDYDVTVQKTLPGDIYVQGPMTFFELGENAWSWSPDVGTHDATGTKEIDGDGRMKFEMDGSVTITHQAIKEEESDTYTYNDLQGTWSIDLENNKLTMSVGMLHPADYSEVVEDWGDITIYSIEPNVLILQSWRSEELSGEGEMHLSYFFVPE